ncbi:DUF1499 domain-containing protein [Aliihoeflea aestuarii]|jgi:hypothetical protein|uniref:DUF1499 domain-containing protein n=1 Tax=Aliihoeflea aestuarii TaxID=453840 RepID=UPI002094E722|nr:DUF1499 domain-containing protein [Aliihoeflea aestuarii]MCO6392143.1 DUF1499 domain-containing protein [Aliihoeflea aestuarii]
MVQYDRRGYAPQAAPARGVAFFAGVLFVLSTLAHRFGAIGTPEFLWVLAITAALAILSLLLAGLALRRVWIEDDAGAGVAFAGVLLALLVLAPFGVGLYGAATNPHLSDVATDPLDPPLLTEAAARREGAMNRVTPITADQAASIRTAYPDLVSRIYDLSLADTIQAVLRVAAERGFEPVAREDAGATGTTLEFTGYSLVVGFASDIAIRLRPDGMRTRVDMRSASRYGSHDQGENARRIGNFLDALDYDVGVMQGVIVEEE